MLPQIDKTYFESGICRIPDQDQDYIDIDKAVENYSKSFFIDRLGYDVYKKLLADNYTVATTEAYKFMYGTEYTVDNVVYKWDGLINSDKISPLSCHIWLNYMPEVWKTNTVSGVMQGQNEQMRMGETRVLQARVAIAMEEMLVSMYDYIYHSEDSLYENINQVLPYEHKYPNYLGL